MKTIYKAIIQIGQNMIYQYIFHKRHIFYTRKTDFIDQKG
jgi:hypothetical protein